MIGGTSRRENLISVSACARKGILGHRNAARQDIWTKGEERHKNVNETNTLGSKRVRSSVIEPVHAIVLVPIYTADRKFLIVH